MTKVTIANNLENYKIQKDTFLITDKNLAALYPQFIAKFDKKYILDPGESSKNMLTICRIYQVLNQKKVMRNTTILAFGGGVVSDISGFVAATYKRGTKFEILSTTIMALDAAIGSKNGVDFNYEKNIIGTFYDAKKTTFAINTFDTLPLQEVKSGYAEIIKHAFLSSKRSYENYVKDGQFLNEETYKFSIKFKQNIVKKDKFDKGDRQKLNFGHTVGHVLEMNSTFTHGEAIMQGIMFELYMSNVIHNAKFDLKKIYHALARKHKYYFGTLDIEFEEMLNDKKNVKENKVTFITLKDFGKAKITELDKNQYIKIQEGYNEFISNFNQM